MTVTLQDGRAATREVTRATGSPESPITDAALDDKFRDCAARTLTPSKVDESLDILHKLEDQASVRALMDAVSGR